jgi:glucan phosphoethanolaminetransferase (alkaline phosphatase superfamily)
VDLFTLIGLLLSVFGAAYSANAALRSHFEEDIKDGAKNAAIKVRYIKANDTSGNAHQSAQQFADKIKIAARVWTVAQWLPILVFSLTSFLLSLFVVFFKTQPQCPDLWNTCRWFLLAVVVFDLICFVAAFIAQYDFRSANAPLTSDYESCVERMDVQSATRKIERPD